MAAAAPEPLTVLRAHDSDVNCVRFGWADASRQLLVSGDAAGDVLVWDLGTRRPCITLVGVHRGGAIEACIVQTAGGAAASSWLYTQGRDNSVCVWDLTALLACAAAGGAGSGAAAPVPVVALPDSDHSFCKMALAAPPPLPAAPEPEPEPEPEPGVDVSVEVSGAREPEPETETETEPAVFGAAPRLVALASTTDSNLSVWDTRKTSADIKIRAPASVAVEAAGLWPGVARWVPVGESRLVRAAVAQRAVRRRA